jgi:hypothetical protein
VTIDKFFSLFAAVWLVNAIFAFAFALAFAGIKRHCERRDAKKDCD